ncbi:Gfo/Idh/MocA family protein [Puniceicoccus vermicola]|uniref:Gfo/Idh/MocA family oxidoreductase n=1 Tax=Puniceicoccus vermicola TaxID=388746 RepID=A0A7X1B0P7_9BACT|nr:Gfo/Idh/MocA family oxidoreductase [Puniceicoccus vermicola]MBC2603481.1 Gfo/Idh/MocA family oxidoreductase [Puniceicoccus vermicola]
MIKLGILGTGGMALAHANAFNSIDGCKIVAACDIDSKRVNDFAAKHGIPEVYTDADEMLAQSDLDAVTIVTPDPFHHPLALKVIAAGKHILCEKPLALNHADALEMRDAAQKAGVINMVNFSYRNSSAIQKATELVAQGALGTIRHVHAYYHQSWLVHDYWGHWPTSPTWLWRLSKSHGSAGVINDIGIHILDFASMPLGSLASVHCRLKCFDKAEGNQIGEYKLDANDSAVITTEFTNGALGTIHTTRWAYPHKNSLRLDLYGDKASIEIDLNASSTELKINRILGRTAMEWETLDCGKTPTNFERFIKSIQTGVQDQPDFARGAEIQSVLDACHLSAENDKTIQIHS